jgi:membrane fusion protein, multidrug efflux system
MATEQMDISKPTEGKDTAAEAAAPRVVAPVAAKKTSTGRKWVVRGILAVVVIGVVVAATPFVISLLNTVSTDDAYVNGHVTFLAPRVSGQVTNVFVDNNNRVHKGDILVQLDKEPYQVLLGIAQATVDAAQSDLTVAIAQAHAEQGQTRSLRFALDHAIEDVDNQIALLKAKVATLTSQQAALDKALADYNRIIPLKNTGAVTQDEVDRRKEVYLVAQAAVQEALQEVYQIRVGLGLPPKPETGDDLTQVPPDLDQTFSTVRQAQASLIQAASQIGIDLPNSLTITPKELIAEFYTFYKGNPNDVEKIYAGILKTAPGVKQAQAKLEEAQSNLAQAQLNLKYCDVVADIDGVITSRDVNPGNNVVAGQSLMAIRSLTDIWIDANFKETQLADLRIGQPVDLEVDMYGSRHHYDGRITGFTEGTGSTLALLPAENATGNFVKVVQRLPVRIDLVNYDPDKDPLFIGLSVEPYVHIYETPMGQDAGKVLQPFIGGVPQGNPEPQP